VEVDGHIIGIPSDLAHMFPEFFEPHMSGENDNSVQVGMPLHEVSVGLVDDIGDCCIGEALSECAYGGRCHYDIADPPEPDQKDSMDRGGINLSFLYRVQWSPHR